MASSEKLELISDSDQLAPIAARLVKAGWFALDLEFASEGRYVPDLCVVQVAWPGSEPGEALLDAMALDLTPIFEVVANSETEVVTHAGRQDLALLGHRYNIIAERFWDTQVAAGFAGIGEQVGYGKLVEELLGTSVDKGPQFTDWTARPLSARQLRYAEADVTHLRELWPILKERLSASGRIDWVAHESDVLARAVAVRAKPEDKYLSVSGGGGLRKKSAAALVELAAWREREALSSNKPPSWILPDNAVVDLCRRLAQNEAALKKSRGVGGGTLRRYGTDIVDAIKRGAGNPPPTTSRPSQLDRKLQPLAALVSVLVGVRCAKETLSVKMVGNKTDCEELVAWHAAGSQTDARPRMMRDWRREYIGDEAVALLDGRAAVRITENGIAFDPVSADSSAAGPEVANE